MSTRISARHLPPTLGPARPAEPDPRRRRRTRDFHPVVLATMDGQPLGCVMPRHFLACLVRPGMAVRLCDQSSDTGIVTHCLETICIVRGEHGEEIPVTYDEMEVIGCRPDPAWVVPARLDVPPTEPPKRGRPGRRPPRVPSAPAMANSPRALPLEPGSRLAGLLSHHPEK